MGSKTKLLYSCLIVLIGALIGLYPAIYNSFPLVNSDSGAYVAFAKSFRTSPIDRSAFYSYFITFASFNKSLQVYILIQSLLGSVLIFSLLCKHFAVYKAGFLSTLMILLLSAFTPYAWYVSQLNPDIFIGYFVLAFIGYWFYSNNKKLSWFYLLLILLSVSVHHSILLLCLILGLIGGVYLWLKKKQYLFQKIKYFFGGTVIIFFLASSINYLIHKSFAPNPSSHVFLVSRIAETGILNKVLEKECPTKHYKICKDFHGFSGRQWDFMWHGQFPHATDGWLNDTVKSEYRDIIKTTLSNREYLKEFVLINIHDAARTLFTINVEDGLRQFNEGSSPWNNIKDKYFTDFKRFEKAKQQTRVLSFSFINELIKWGTAALLFVTLILYLVADSKNKFKNINIVLFVIIVYLLNALITTTLSTYLGRFNARLVWVLPLGLVIASFRALKFNS